MSVDCPDRDEPDAVMSAIARIRAYGRNAGADAYAGSVLNGVGVTVYRVPHDDFDGYIRASEWRVPVMLVDAAHSRAELVAARDRVWAMPDVDEILAMTVPVDGSRLIVVVEEDVVRAQRQFDAALPGLVRVERRSFR